MQKAAVLFLFFLFVTGARASHQPGAFTFKDQVVIIEGKEFFPHAGDKDSPIPFLRKIQSAKNKITAAVLSFPLPLGILGAHRIYLGSKPFIPVIYIATFGGCFGILPFIDFIVILIEKDMTPYENNSKVFMWVR